MEVPVSLDLVPVNKSDTCELKQKHFTLIGCIIPLTGKMHQKNHKFPLVMSKLLSL